MNARSLSWLADEEIATTYNEQGEMFLMAARRGGESREIARLPAGELGGYKPLKAGNGYWFVVRAVQDERITVIVLAAAGNRLAERTAIDHGISGTGVQLVGNKVIWFGIATH